MSVDSLQEKTLSSKEYKQRKKIQTVLEEIERVKEQRRRADDFLNQGLIDVQTAERMFRDAVMDLIIEAKYLMQESDEKIKVRYEDGDSDELECIEYFWNHAYLGHANLAGDVYEFHGLSSILPENFGDPEVVRVKQTETDHFSGETTETAHLEYQVPWEVSWSAYVELRDFMGIHGLELEYDEGRPFNDWRDEYEDGIYVGQHEEDEADV